MYRKLLTRLFLLLVLALFSGIGSLKAAPGIPQQSDFYIDLNKLPVYVHIGFSEQLTSTIPDDSDTSWQVVPPLT